MEFDIMSVLLGMLGTVLGIIFSYVAFLRNRDKDSKSEGRQDGVMLTELGYIKANTEDIKAEQKEQRKINNDVFERLASVESSAKQAHHRLDRLEEHENHQHQVGGR